MDELVATIELDPALLVEFIQLADGQAVSIDRWHQNLDAEFIKAVAVYRVLAHLRSRQEVQFADACWQESLLFAFSNESFARLLGGDPREAYLTGLLVNIGRYLLFDRYGREYAELLQGAGPSVTDLLAQEQQSYGTDSLALARGLLTKWHCNPFMVDAVAFHPIAPELLMDAELLVRITAVSRWINPILLRAESSVHDDALCARIEQLLGVTREPLEELMRDVSTRVEQAFPALGKAASTGTGLTQQNGKESLESTSDRVTSESLRSDADNLSVIALIQNAFDRSSELDSWWLTVQKSARLLFDFDRCFLFNLDLEQDRIIASEFSPEVSRISIARQPERSLLVDCLVSRQPVDSFNAARITVVDRQLRNLAGSEGFVCLPLLVAGTPIGVLVAGVELPSVQRLGRLEGLRTLFSNLVATTLVIRQQQQNLSREEAAASARAEAIDLDHFRMRTREVTHEVSNPLSIVQNYLKILSLKLEDDHSAQHNLKIIGDEMVRISSIINKFSEIGPDSNSRDQININRTVSDMVAIIREATPDVNILLDLDTSTPLTVINPDALKQILINLMQNAVEAVKGEGSVKVQTRSQVNVNGKMFVELVVSDDGPGIPASFKRKLFKPVDTTKGGQHEGLGLTIVKRLIDDMQGTISCRGGDGEGACFQILIPQQGLEN